MSVLSALFCAAISLVVGNTGDIQRQEVAEADLQAVCRQLGVGIDAPLTVTNALGQAVTYQKTYDGKLLLYVAVQPGSEAVFRVASGESSSRCGVAPKSYVRGRCYPERADDITWENDFGIYRVYGPALQRSGERSFGTDVWVKNTPELLVEERYRMHRWGVGQRDSLRRIDKPDEADRIYMSTSFHHDHGQGLDCYAVGASLGCGAPALMKDGDLQFPYCYKTYRILDNGPLRFTVELTYNTAADGTTEHRIISLDRGSHFNRMTVWYDGIKEPVALAAGVVLHSEDAPLLDNHYVLYADPTENPKVHQSQIYVATLFPSGVDEALVLKGRPAHGLGIVRHYSGAPYTYYFGSAWSSYDVRTMSQWLLTAKEFLSNLANPLAIRIE